MYDLTQQDDGIRFNAKVGALFDPHGVELSSEIGRRVYRDDTGETMAVCGPRFQPIQHHEIVDPILGKLEEQGYHMIERAPNKRSLYDLAGKSGAFVSHDMIKNGAVLRTNIVLGNFIQPTGQSNYLDDGPDLNFFRISVLNSHDGTYSALVNTDYLRLVCMNGMTRPNFQAGFYGRHTSGFSIDAMAAQITSAMDMMSEDADRFGRMASTPITVKVAEQMLKMTIAKLPNKPNGEPHYSEPLVNKILGRFQREDQTVWGLYNAITWWATHSEIKANSTRLTATIGREKKVSAMLRSSQWASVLA